MAQRFLSEMSVLSPVEIKAAFDRSLAEMGAAVGSVERHGRRLPTEDTARRETVKAWAVRARELLAEGIKAAEALVADLPRDLDEISVGDRVRSFDFADGPDGRTLEGERACYAEGVVEAIGEDVIEGCPRYRIRVTRRVFGGDDKAIREPHVYPPVNGTPTTLGRITDGVWRIEGEAEPPPCKTFEGRRVVAELKVPASVPPSPRELTEAADEVAAAEKAAETREPIASINAAIAEFHKVGNRNADFGARDSEPIAIFRHLVAAAAKGERCPAPRGVRAWDLYEGHKGAGKAARELTAAAVKVTRAIREGRRTAAETVRRYYVGR